LAGTPTQLEAGNRRGPAFSLDLSIEYSYLLLLGSLQVAGLGGGQAELFSLRAGAIFGSGSVAGYLAAGAGTLYETFASPADCGGPGNSFCLNFEGSGLSWIGEAGVIFFHDNRFGRAAIFVEWVQPTFDVSTGVPYERTLRVPIWTLGVRLQI